VRVGLLEVAAHAAPEDTHDVLVDLVGVFGEDLYVRTRACELLAETFPEEAAEVLEPLLTERRRSGTYPPEDRMLAAWLTAKERLGEDPSQTLARMATDMNEYAEARHLATRRLAGTTDPHGRAALEQLLVESSGNAYLRRLAAQSLQETLPPEVFCKKIEEVANHEADPAFQVFLVDMSERNCP